MAGEQRGTAYELWREVERWLNEHPEVTKTELAKRAQVSRPTLNRLAHLHPDRATVQRIAKAIGIPYGRALTLAGYSHATDPSANTRRAILEDPLFDGQPERRKQLLDLYDLFASMAPGQHPAPPAEEQKPARKAPGRKAAGGTQERRRAG